MPTRYPPIDIEIASSLLPYTDLNLQGDPKRNLRIPNDVVLALAGILGIESNGIPRMAHMSPTGALFTSEAGGGTNDSLADLTNANPGVPFVLNFASICSLFYICCQDQPFDIVVTGPPGGNQATMRIFAGFQVFWPLSANQLTVTNQGSANGLITIVGFFHNPNIPSPAL